MVARSGGNDDAGHGVPGTCFLASHPLFPEVLGTCGENATVKRASGDPHDSQLVRPEKRPFLTVFFPAERPGHSLHYLEGPIREMFSLGSRHCRCERRDFVWLEIYSLEANARCEPAFLVTIRCNQPKSESIQSKSQHH